MCASWNEKSSNPGLLVAEINRTRREHCGKVSYTGFSIEWFQSALLSAIRFDQRIPAGISPSLVSRALSCVTDSGKLSVEGLINTINQEERRYLGKPFREFRILTSISAGGKMPFQTVKFDGVKINLGALTRFDRSRALESARELLHGEPHDRYKSTLLYLAARSPQEAFDKAIDAFDVVRGLWNLYLNLHQTLSITLSGTPKAVNKLRLGPLHTRHHEDGSLADTAFWYDPGYARAGELYYIDPDMSEKLKRNFIKPRNLLARSPLAQDAYEGIRRYCRALDSWDLSQAFTQLWSALEYLTDTTESSYDVTVRRAAARSSDYQVTLEILKHLRHRRNRLVHATKSQRDIETLVYQLKWSVENLLRFFISNPGKLRSRQEVGEFLDAAKDIERLNRRIHVLSACRRLRPSRSKES